MTELASLMLYRADGPSGRLRCGYQDAGHFGVWQLAARSRDRWTVTATDAHLHGYYAEHAPGPLTVRLELGPPGYWEAPVELIAASPLRLRGLAPVTAHEREES